MDSPSSSLLVVGNPLDTKQPTRFGGNKLKSSSSSSSNLSTNGSNIGANHNSITTTNNNYNNSLWPNCPNGCHDACSLAALSVHKAQIAGVSLPGRFRITMRRVHGSLHQQLLLNRSVRWLCQRLLLSEAVSQLSTASSNDRVNGDVEGEGSNEAVCLVSKKSA